MTPGPASRTTRAAVFAAVCVATTALGHTLMSERTVPWWGLAAALAGTFGAAWRLTARERGALVVIASTVAAQLGLHCLLSLAQASAAGPPDGHPYDIPWLRRMLCGMSGHSLAWHSQRAADRLPHQAGLGASITHILPTPTPGGMGTAGAMPGMDGMPHNSMAHMGSAAGQLGHQMSQMSIAHPGHGLLGMFLAHLLAAVVCGGWLWQGEAAAFRLARALVAVVFAPLVFVMATLGRTPIRRPAIPAPTAFTPPLHGALLQHTLSRRGPPTVSLCC
ncbi:PE-PGRS family protein [Streptomyces sp. CT34]|uniref:PE-PGRS family protein n=1 Tax=Streptomyces sp. CT34 TaxID=1553907 RepID=UPI0012FF2B78|nr:PE-PGRS family protein [Streptomyces sp. CT34]